MKQKWKRLHKEYSARLKALKAQRAQQEAQQQAQAGGAGSGSGSGGDAAERGAATEAQGEENEWRDRYFALVSQLREEHLLAPYAAEREACPLVEPPRLLAEASALYEAVYDEAINATHATDEPKFYVAFVWHAAGDLLLYVRKARLCRERDPSIALFTS